MSSLCPLCRLPTSLDDLDYAPNNLSCGLCSFMFSSKPSTSRICQCKRSSTSSPSSNHSNSTLSTRAPLLDKRQKIHRRSASLGSARPPSPPPPREAVAALVPFPLPTTNNQNQTESNPQMSERKSQDNSSTTIHISRPRRLTSSTTTPPPPSSITRHLASLNANRPSTSQGFGRSMNTGAYPGSPPTSPPPLGWTPTRSRLHQMSHNMSSESLRNKIDQNSSKDIDFEESVLSLARRQSDWVRVDANEAKKLPHYQKVSAMPYSSRDGEEDGDEPRKRMSGADSQSRPTSMMSINVVDTPDGRKLRKVGSIGVGAGGSIGGRVRSGSVSDGVRG